MIKKILLALLAVMLISCSNEKLIDESDSNQKLLVASFDGTNSHIMKSDLKSTLSESNDLYTQANGSFISHSPITRMQSYLNYVFAFAPDENKIFIFNKNTTKVVAQIDFSDEGLRPMKLAFANATDAYLICENYNKLILLDILYFKKAREIDLPSFANDILALGNKIYITIPLENQVAIVDSRTHTITSQITVDNRPYIFALTSSSNNLIVLSAGAGKLPQDPMENLSAPSVANIDLASSSIVGTNPLVVPLYDIINKYPKEFVITNNDWGFFSLDSMLVKIDARDITFSISLYNAILSNFSQNYLANEIFVLEKTDFGSFIEKLNPISGAIEESQQTQLNLTSFVSF
jgi:hypothetical protein